MSRHLALWKRHQKNVGSTKHDDVVTEEAIAWFEAEWAKPNRSLTLLPGKSALSAINQEIQAQCAVSIAPSGIVSAMNVDEIPLEMRELIELIGTFSAG